MLKAKKHIISIFSMFFCFMVFSQENPIDNLLKDMINSTSIQSKTIYKVLDSIDQLDPKIINKINYNFYYRLKGLAFEDDNNFIEAYNTFLKGVEYAKNKKDPTAVGDFSIFLGDLLYKVEAIDKAEEYYKKAEDVFIKQNNINRLLDLKLAKGYNYFQTKKYKKSLQTLLDNYTKFEKLGNPIFLLNANYKIHSNFLKLDNKQKADIYYKKFLNLKNASYPLIQKEEIVKCYNFNLEYLNSALIEYFISKKNIDSAQFYINKLDAFKMKRNASKTADYFKLLTDFNNLQENKENYYKYKDSLHETLEKINNKKIKTNVDLNEKINSFKQLLQKEKKISKRFYYILTLLLITILITLYLYKKSASIMKLFKIKEKQINTLNSQLENQTTINLKLKDTENFINEIKKELKEITRINDFSNRKIKIQDLFIKIHEKSSADRFEGSYEQLYLFSPSFFDQLSSIFTELNKNELIVCFYININLKNNEIASLLNKSIRSIESTRYRIRKKMNIIDNKMTLKEKIKLSIIK